MGRFNVLVVSGGEIHDYKGCGRRIRAALEGDDRFQIAYLEQDLDCFADGRLEGSDAVVLFYTVGELSVPQRDGLLDYVASGKGFVGVHSAADSFRGCPGYRAMVGGHFVSHPHYRQYQVSVTDVEHPATAGLDEFMVTDEQYITDYDPRVSVLASALWRGRAAPVVWTKSWGRGRVFYVALGHNSESCDDPNFKLLLCRGTAWAAEATSG